MEMCVIFQNMNESPDTEKWKHKNKETKNVARNAPNANH